MSAPAAPGPRVSRAGFSLVEVLVAMTLTGLVLAALAMVTATWLPAWRRGLGRVEASELLALALDRVAFDLAAAAFVPQNVKSRRPLFEGTPDRVTFVRDAIGPNAAPGLEIVELAQVGDGRGTALARRTAPYGPLGEDAELPPFGAPVGVLRAPFRVAFSYAGRDGVWRDGWSGADELPRAVRLVVRDAATGRATGASTAVIIRAELPAACVSDVNTRMCGQPLAGGVEPAAQVRGGGAGDGAGEADE